jgi:hypothetical protein
MSPYRDLLAGHSRSHPGQSPAGAGREAILITVAAGDHTLRRASPAALPQNHGIAVASPTGIPVTATRRFTAQASPVADSPWEHPLARGVFDRSHNGLARSARRLVIEATYPL